MNGFHVLEHQSQNGEIVSIKRANVYVHGM